MVLAFFPFFAFLFPLFLWVGLIGGQAFVDFERQPLCNPGQEVVTLVNNDPSQSLKLFGISTKSDDVHCTWFDMEDVAPGENTSFQVVHLGKSIGRLEASLTLSTSFGDLSYQVYANSVLSAMRARPLSNGRVPVGVTYTQPITVFNPLDTPLSVLEIYTSNDLLHLEPTESLTTGGYAGNENWQIGPRESKSVMQLRTTGEAPGLVQGYVHVLTNVSEADVVISVRVEVLEEQGLYHGPGDSIDFGALTTTDSPQIREIIILSNTDQVLRILNAKVDDCTNLFGDATSCPVRPRYCYFDPSLSVVSLPGISQYDRHIVFRSRGFSYHRSLFGAFGPTYE